MRWQVSIGGVFVLVIGVIIPKIGFLYLIGFWWPIGNGSFIIDTRTSLPIVTKIQGYTHFR
jgi:hypothetical protein